MKRSLRLLLLIFALAGTPLTLRLACASVVTWDVDPTNSYIRLTIPDQTLNVTNVGNVTLKMRDAGDNNQWTDAGGRRAALNGEIVTDYADGESITFLGGQHSLRALEATNLRPNPADWSSATTNYSGTTTAPAALGGRVRGTYLLTFDAAFIAFRSVLLDITNTLPGSIAITNGVLATNTTQCGIATARVDVDGLALPLGLGQPVPDVSGAQLGQIVQQNAGGGSITNLGGLNRRLTYTINIPELALDLSGMVVTASAAGVIMASAVIPAPPQPPSIGVKKQGSEIVLTWPANATGFSLQYSVNLPPTNWTVASPTAVVANGQYVVTNALTGDSVFYRLHKP
jgi:hypothetical protein